MKGTAPKRGYFGVVIQPMTDDIAAGLGLPKDVGEIVARVEPGQPAARAGIMQGDVIVKVNGTDVTPDNTLSFIVAGLPIGTRVPVDYIRNGKRGTTTAVVSQRPPEDQLASASGDDDEDGPMGNGQETPAVKNALGVTLQAMTPGIARQLGVTENTAGVVITSVDPSSDAASKGLQPKDIIVAVGQRRVTTVAEAAAAVDAAQKSGLKTVLLLIQRGNRPAQYLGVDLAGK